MGRLAKRLQPVGTGVACAIAKAACRPDVESLQQRHWRTVSLFLLSVLRLIPLDYLWWKAIGFIRVRMHFVTTTALKPGCRGQVPANRSRRRVS